MLVLREVGFVPLLGLCPLGLFHGLMFPSLHARIINIWYEKKASAR
jgi:hypothetical protein